MDPEVTEYVGAARGTQYRGLLEVSSSGWKECDLNEMF